MSKLLCFGEVLVDLIPIDRQGLSHQAIAGGAPANVAVGFAKLGGYSGFAGGVSTDSYGAMLEQALADYGVNTQCLAKIDAPTATVLVTLDEQGERTFSFNRHNTADMSYTKAHVERLDWSQWNMFHFCSNTFTDTAMFEVSLIAIKNAFRQHKLVSFDVNLRLSLWSTESLISERVERCLPYTHVLKMSRDEAKYLADAKGLSITQYIQFCLVTGVETIVLTDGGNPVECINTHYQFKVAAPAIQAVDTTAGGDSFIAGFLYALADLEGSHIHLIQSLSNAKWVKSAVQFAIQCGAYTCQHKGAFPAMPTLAQLNWVEEKELVMAFA